MRRVFFSFDWDDVWRANQVRNSWIAQGNYETAGFVDAADIEAVKKAADNQIRNWIDKQLEGTSVTCVLIGSQTADSKWVNYEIVKSINKSNGLIGVYVHKVKDKDRSISDKGEDPFGRPPINFVSSTNPKYPCCSYYDWISAEGYQNLGDWIEKAAQQAGR